MIDVSVTVDIGDVDRGLDAMQRRAHLLGFAFRALKKPMREDQRDHAKAKEGPDGAWPARKVLGSSPRKGRRRRARRLLGKLPNAIIVAAESDRIIARSRASWSAVHQDGGRAGHGAVIPRRQFLWISDELMNKAVEVIGEYVIGGW